MPANTHTVVGHTKRFECRVIGHPRPEIKWFKDGRDITHLERYHFAHTYEGVISMAIEDVHHADEGHYRCRAENSEGFASTSAYLIVRPHKEHPDEEIEEVHAMQLEEHFVYKSSSDRTIMVGIDEDVDSAHKRTFEQIVGEEKENVRIINGTASKSFSSSTEESSSYSKKAVNGFEEVSSSRSSKKVKTSSEEGSIIQLGSEQERSLKSESSASRSVAKSEKSVSVSSSSVEESSRVSAESEETVIGISVETEQSSSSFRSSKSSVKASVETESVSSTASSKKSKDSQEQPSEDMTDSALFSLCNDSGFMEASMLESSHSESSVLDSAETTSSVESVKKESAKSTKTEVKTETTTVSEEVSRAEEVVSIVGGDITGLLDEMPDPTTAVAEEQEVAAVEEDQRGRWVDHVASKAETISIEGEGKKVEELKAKAAETATADEKQETSDLKTATTKNAAQASVGAQSMAARQGSVVDEIQVVSDEAVASTVEGSQKKKKGSHESMLEVDEGISALNVLGLERVRPGFTAELEECSVDAVKVGEGAEAAPRIVAAPDDMIVVLGEAIRLVAQVQGNPVPEVKWFKAGDTVKAGERITLTTADDTFTLEITNALESDGGTYTLTAHNAQGTIFSDVLVTVDIPPSIGPSDEEIRLTASLNIPEFVMQPGNVTVKELGRLKLVCTIKANPGPTVKWSKGGKSLISDSHISIFESEGEYHLEIPKATAEDGGDYTCTAANSEGSVSCTISVVVESKESSLSGADEGAGAALRLRESSSDVSTLEPATQRYLKLVAAAAAFSLAAFGLKKVVENLSK